MVTARLTEVGKFEETCGKTTRKFASCHHSKRLLKSSPSKHAQMKYRSRARYLRSRSEILTASAARHVFHI